MLRRGHKGKVDGNHKTVKAIAEAHGWQVVSLASTGDGCPDLLCWREAHGFKLVEVKVGKAKYTQAQERFRQRYAMPIVTVRSEEDAKAVFGGRDADS